MGLNETVSAERIHIGFFGLRNAGKSSLVNAVTGQSLSVVSDVKGTTTDPVKKTMELNVDLFVVPNLIDVGKTNAKIVRFDDVLTLYMPEKNLSGIEKILKRAIDIVLSLVGLVIAAIPI